MRQWSTWAYTTSVTSFSKLPMRQWSGNHGAHYQNELSKLPMRQWSDGRLVGNHRRFSKLPMRQWSSWIHKLRWSGYFLSCLCGSDRDYNDAVPFYLFLSCLCGSDRRWLGGRCQVPVSKLPMRQWSWQVTRWQVTRFSKLPMRQWSTK